MSVRRSGEHTDESSYGQRSPPGEGRDDDPTTRRRLNSRPLPRVPAQPPGLPGRIRRRGGARPGRLRHRRQAALLRRKLRDDDHRGDRVQLADDGRDQPVAPVRERAPGHPPVVHLAAGERGARQDHRGRVHPGRRVRHRDDQQLRDADVVSQRLAGEPAAVHQRHPRLRRERFPAPAAGHAVAQGGPVLGAVLRRVLVPHVPQGPDGQGGHQDAGPAHLDPGAEDRRRDAQPQEGTRRHLPAR